MAEATIAEAAAVRAALTVIMMTMMISTTAATTWTKTTTTHYSHSFWNMKVVSATCWSMTDTEATSKFSQTDSLVTLETDLRLEAKTLTHQAVIL